MAHSNESLQALRAEHNRCVATASEERMAEQERKIFGAHAENFRSPVLTEPWQESLKLVDA